VEIREDQIPQLVREGKGKETVPLLYKKVFPVVKKYILSHGGIKEDAFDLFQDALVDFYAQVMAGEYKEQYKVYGYLYKFSIHKWINKVKREKKITFQEDLSIFENREGPVAEYGVLGKEDNLLRSLFAPIGDKCIELLTYTVLNNMLLEDIVLRMNLPSVAAAKMQQLRCKQKLAEEIAKRPELINRLKGV
jgi:DNA-directed RNA polymerase specialized sigma24 family protein